MKQVLDRVLKIFGHYGFLKGLSVYTHVILWVIHKRLLGSKHLVRKVYDFKMLLPLYEPGIAEHLNMFGTREGEQVYMLRSFLKEDMCVLDIGGNIGYYTLMSASIVGPSGKVYSIEPVPSNCEILRQSVNLNAFQNRVEVFQAAVSDKAGSGRMCLSHQSNLHSFHNVENPATPSDLLDLSGEMIDVSTTTLTAFLQDKQLPDLIRMDVEGHEIEILESLLTARSTLNWHPVIMFETHPQFYDRKDHDISVPLLRLFESGYKLKYAASNREPASALHAKGFSPGATLEADGRTRGIYNDVPVDELIELLYIPDQIRAVMLAPTAAST